MNAHLKPDIVFRVTLYQPLIISEHSGKGLKETLAPGEYDIKFLLGENGRVDWFVFPQFGGKGLPVHAMRSRESNNKLVVEQNINGEWEDYFQ